MKNTYELNVAIARIYELKKNNPKWSMKLIIGRVADWNKLDYNVLSGEIRRRNYKKKKVIKPIVVEPTQEDFQPPWWTYNN